jgi:hypothetical protein
MEAVLVLTVGGEPAPSKRRCRNRGADVAPKKPRYQEKRRLPGVDVTCAEAAAPVGTGLIGLTSVDGCDLSHPLELPVLGEVQNADGDVVLA